MRITVIELNGRTFELDVTETTTLNAAIRQMVTRHSFPEGHYDFYYAGKQLRNPRPFANVINKIGNVIVYRPPLPRPGSAPRPPPDPAPAPADAPPPPAPPQRAHSGGAPAPARPPHFDVVSAFVNRLGIAPLYDPANDLYAHPEIVGRFIAGAATLAGRVAVREALLTRAASVLRHGGACEDCVFELCGLELPADLGVDEREVRIACFDRPRRQAFERLLAAGRGPRDTYDAFERTGFNEEEARRALHGE
jgi:hypothetical protein